MSEATATPPAGDPARTTIAGQAAGPSSALLPRLPRTLSDDERFRLGLLTALTIHLLLALSFLGAEPRRLGSEGGVENAIAVEFVPDPDPASRATVSDRAAGQPSPPPQPQSRPAPQRLPAPPAAPAEAEAEPPPPSEPARETAAAAPAPRQEAEAPDPAPALRPTLSTPEPAATPAEAPPRKSDADATAQSAKPDKAPPKATEKPHEKPPEKVAKPAPKPKPAAPAQQQMANLDMTPPSSPPISVSVGNGGAGLDRPPGITRSGLNDEFARGVIRALQRTMPQISTLGRVTVKITLNMSGNLVETTVIRPSSVAGLDQAVVFATRQSSFPLPPGNSKPVDLIFFVTYIYR